MALDPKAVPNAYSTLLSLAEHWGIEDDDERSVVVEAATREERQALIDAVSAAPNAFWDWLVAESHPPCSLEWSALNDLTQAFDLARTLNQP